MRFLYSDAPTVPDVFYDVPHGTSVEQPGLVAISQSVQRAKASADKHDRNSAISPWSLLERGSRISVSRVSDPCERRAFHLMGISLGSTRFVLQEPITSAWCKGWSCRRISFIRLFIQTILHLPRKGNYYEERISLPQARHIDQIKCTWFSIPSHTSYSTQLITFNAVSHIQPKAKAH